MLLMGQNNYDWGETLKKSSIILINICTEYIIQSFIESDVTLVE